VSEVTEPELQPGLDRRQRLLLKQLAADEQNPVLAELARELIAGRTTPAEVLVSRAYDEALGPGAEALTAWYAGASEEDREAAAAQGRAELVRLTEDELAGVPDEPQAVPAPEEDLSERTWSSDSW
jgi:hypothetical protein